MIFVALVLAAAVPQAGTAEAPKPDTSDRRMVCRRISRTGSRMAAKRVCLPAFEWLQTEKRAQRDVGDLKLRSQMEQTPNF